MSRQHLARSFNRILTILCIFFGLLAMSASAQNQRAAILADDRPDAQNAATDLASVLNNSGYSVQFISRETLSSIGNSSPSPFKLLVLPHARSVAAAEVKAVSDFVHHGGSLLALGTPMGLGDAKVESFPYLESVSPAYQFYPVNGPVTFTVSDAIYAMHSSLRNPEAQLLAMHPRARGIGFDQRRSWRWQPFLEARSPSGDYRGAIGALAIDFDGPARGAVCASITVDDQSFYRQRRTSELLGRLLTRLHRGVFLKEGGSEFFTVFDGQTLRCGATVANFGGETQERLHLRLTIAPKKGGKARFSREWALDLKPGEERTFEDSWLPTHWPSGGLAVTTEVLANGVVIDWMVHDLNVWRPNSKPQFVQIEDGHFSLNGKRWKVNGVNYMPSSGIALENGTYFEYWLGKGAYDPEVIQRDLDRIKRMGLNAVSIFIDHRSLESQHLLDFLRRCEVLGIHVNLSLRPGTPLDFHWDQVKEIIEHYHLTQNDTIFAYDLAWEPSHGGQQAQQQVYGRDWTPWVTRKYGSLDNAEKSWAFACPRTSTNAPELQVPSMRLLTHDGEWRRLIADYRAFLDEELGHAYGEARRLVQSTDPHHAVSFRMSNTGDPTYNWDGALPYDFYGLANAVDIWEPEAYGRIGDWEKVKPGRFERDYARLCDPAKPYMWAEMGFDAWDKTAMQTATNKLAFEGRYFADFYRMMIDSGADGVVFWWYPGGYRLNERSDFGIINPDGTDRPATQVIRSEGARFLKAAFPPPADTFIPIQRDRDTRGIFGIYESAKNDYWAAIAAHKTPGLSWEQKPGEQPLRP
jgi:hypothetical protein